MPHSRSSRTGLWTVSKPRTRFLQAASELQQLTGFHIKRAEFDPEYDNEAELLVAEMEFKDDDSKVGHCTLADAFRWATRVVVRESSLPTVQPSCSITFTLKSPLSGLVKLSALSHPQHV